MDKKKNLIIICVVFMTLFTGTKIFASNIGRTVYGILTETYNGTSTNASAGNDKVWIYGNVLNDTDKKEGTFSNSIGIGAWLGVYFNLNGEWSMNPQDMSDYIGGRLYFSAKVPTSVDTEDTNNAFKISDGVDKIVRFNSTNIKRIDNGSTILGTAISNDDQWHTYYIELSSFTNLDFTNISYPFIVGCSASNGAAVLIDNVYWTKAPSVERSFNVTVKNISNNQTVSSVTWNQSCFRQGWIAADQYVELDLDWEGTNDWYVQILLDNGKATRNGLYYVADNNSEFILQMAWRVSRDLLPNGSGDTLQITKSGAPNYSLYDSGKHNSDPWWYPWIYFKEKKETFELEYTTVWNIKGCHTYAGANAGWDSLNDFYDKKPKIYFAADCENSWNFIYAANIVIILNYE